MRDGAEVWAEVRSHPDPFARALLEQAREAGVVQMADRVRAVWHERLIVLATDLPVDLDVDLLVTQGELMRAVREAAAAARALRERGAGGCAPSPARNGAEGIRRSTDGTRNRDSIRVPSVRSANSACLLPTGGTPIPAALFATLPPAEAFRRAAEAAPRPARRRRRRAASCASACAGTGWSRPGPTCPPWSPSSCRPRPWPRRSRTPSWRRWRR